VSAEVQAGDDPTANNRPGPNRPDSLSLASLVSFRIFGRGNRCSGGTVAPPLPGISNSKTGAQFSATLPPPSRSRRPAAGWAHKKWSHISFSAAAGSG